jgi:hypothetical protein
LTLGDVLPRKLLSPEYVAVRVLAPVVLKVIAQLPDPFASEPTQLSPVLAFTVTLPVGTPFPVTLKLTETGAPIADAFGVLEVIVVALLPWVIVSVPGKYVTA